MNKEVNNHKRNLQIVHFAHHPVMNIFDKLQNNMKKALGNHTCSKQYDPWRVSQSK